jgi:cell wall-associated NlpC family hydrolase
MSKLTNVGLVAYALAHARIGTRYVLGTNCRVLTKERLESLIKTNPSNWFTDKRVRVVRTWVGSVTTDCHGLIEGYCNDDDLDYTVEQFEGSYDTYADGAFNQATIKGEISTMDKSMIGLCVRFKGHVGVYIGNGLVAEARGFDYGVCITKLEERQWTHLYKHNSISYDPADSVPTSDITPTSRVTDILWLQWRVGEVTDGKYGPDTAEAYRNFTRYKGWQQPTGWYVGKNGIKALCSKK